MNQAGTTSAGVALSVSRELAGQMSVADRAAAELRTSAPGGNESVAASPKPTVPASRATTTSSTPVPTVSGEDTTPVAPTPETQTPTTPTTPAAKSTITALTPAPPAPQNPSNAAATTAAATPTLAPPQPSPTAASVATAAPVAGARSAPTTQVDLGGTGAGRTGVARASTKPNAPTTPDAKEVISKATQGLAAAIRQKGGSVVLKLEPESLGQLRITVSMRNGVVNAKIEAGTSEAAELLKTHQSALRESMHEKGMLVERLEIVDASHTAKELAPDLRTDRLVHLPLPDLSRSSDDSNGSTSNDSSQQHETASPRDENTNDRQYASREDQSSPDDAWRHAAGADHAVDSFGTRSLINALA
ncbi:MAG: flagellar hook-length control protein FliK [Phycisphaerales bacterium]|nr:MAG: flagellar hook-length control protein FliK [Phycisphaerales bacterium]